MSQERQQYLELIEKIINKKSFKNDRTKVGTFSIFGANQRYNLHNSTLPIITTKKMFIRGIIEELLWMISGSTDVDVLKSKNVHFWNANADSNGGDLGPIYGFQWRHFGAKYIDSKTDYTNQGVDQLAECIRLIKTDPDSRRIIMSAWNPMDLEKMALPPCHCFVQFYVKNDTLSCHLYQRSADMGLGVPFNITSYCLLTHMIAHVTNLKAGEFIYTTGDTHVYLNHVDALKEQCNRDPFEFPKLRFRRRVERIDDFRLDDFEIVNYTHHPKIDLPMAL